MAGIPDKQVPCPDELVEFRYMWNSSGSKVRARPAGHELGSAVHVGRDVGPVAIAQCPSCLLLFAETCT